MTGNWLANVVGCLPIATTYRKSGQNKALLWEGFLLGLLAPLAAAGNFAGAERADRQFRRDGAGAFVGSNSSLVAPAQIVSGAYIGSGSVITREVPDDALAVERSQQTNREGGAKRYRELKTRGNTPKKRLTTGAV